jgi:hypothetical protein
MNGTMVKLVASASIEGKWTTNYPGFHNTHYMQIETIGDSSFTTSVGSSASGPWTALIKGSYTKGENPVPCTVSEVNAGFLAGGPTSWTTWSSLSSAQQQTLGGSPTMKMAVYDNTCKGAGVIFTKQQQ